MKKYIILVLIFLSLFLFSIIYKIENRNILGHFPSHQNTKENKSTSPYLNLFIFFSVKNCKPCLEIIEVLNKLPEEFNVIGIIPENEFAIEEQVRRITKAKFKVVSQKKFKRFSPNYYPTIIGVSPREEILFVLPGVPNEKEYLINFLNDFFKKANILLYSGQN